MSGLNSRTANGLRNLASTHLIGPYVSGDITSLSGQSDLSNFRNAEFTAVSNENGPFEVNSVEATVPLHQETNAGKVTVSLLYDSSLNVNANGELAVESVDAVAPLFNEPAGLTLEFNPSKFVVIDNKLDLTTQLSSIGALPTERAVLDPPFKSTIDTDTSVTTIDLAIDDTLAVSTGGQLGVSESLQDGIAQAINVGPVQYDLPLIRKPDTDTTQKDHVSLQIGKGLEQKDGQLETNFDEIIKPLGALGTSTLADIGLTEALSLGFESLAKLASDVPDAEVTILKLNCTDDFTQEGSKLAVKSQGDGRILYTGVLDGLSSRDTLTFNETSSTLSTPHVSLTQNFDPDDLEAVTKSYVAQYIQSEQGSGIDVLEEEGNKRLINVRYDASLQVNDSNDLGVNVGALVDGKTVRIVDDRISNGLTFQPAFGLQIENQNMVKLKPTVAGAITFTDENTIGESLSASKGVQRVENDFSLNLSSGNSQILVDNENGTVTGNISTKSDSGLSINESVLDLDLSSLIDNNTITLNGGKLTGNLYHFGDTFDVQTSSDGVNTVTLDLKGSDHITVNDGTISTDLVPLSGSDHITVSNGTISTDLAPYSGSTHITVFNNEISTDLVPLVAGENCSITNNTLNVNLPDDYTAGSNISIENRVISAEVPEQLTYKGGAGISVVGQIINNTLEITAGLGITVLGSAETGYIISSEALQSKRDDDDEENEDDSNMEVLDDGPLKASSNPNPNPPETVFEVGSLGSLVPAALLPALLGPVISTAGVVVGPAVVTGGVYGVLGGLAAAAGGGLLGSLWGYQKSRRTKTNSDGTTQVDSNGNPVYDLDPGGNYQFDPASGTNFAIVDDKTQRQTSVFMDTPASIYGVSVMNYAMTSDAIGAALAPVESIVSANSAGITSLQTRVSTNETAIAAFATALPSTIFTALGSDLLVGSGLVITSNVPNKTLTITPDLSVLTSRSYSDAQYATGSAVTSLTTRVATNETSISSIQSGLPANVYALLKTDLLISSGLVLTPSDMAKSITFGIDGSVVTLKSYADGQYATISGLNTTNTAASALTSRVSLAEGNITVLQTSKQANLTFTSPLANLSNVISLNSALITQLGTLTSLQVSGEVTTGKSIVVGNTIAGDTTSAKVYPPITPLTGFSMTVTAADYGYGLYTVSVSSTAGNFFGYYGFTTALTGAPWSSQGYYNAGSGAYTGSVSTSDTLGSTYPGEWLQIQFPLARLIKTFTIFPRVDNPLSAPTTFTLLASNDGSNWSAIFKQTSAITWVNNTSQTFTSNATQPYSYFRVVGGSTGGGNNASVSPYLQFSMFFTTVNTGVNLGSVSDSILLPSVNALGCVSVANTLTAATVRNNNGALNINNVTSSAPLALTKTNGVAALALTTDSSLGVTSGALGINTAITSLTNYVPVSTYNSSQTALPQTVYTYLKSDLLISSGLTITPSDSAKTLTFALDPAVVAFRSYADGQFATISSLNTTNSNASALTTRVSTAEGNISSLQSSKQANLSFSSPLSVTNSIVALTTDSSLVVTSGALGVSPTLTTLTNYVKTSTYSSDQTALPTTVYGYLKSDLLTSSGLTLTLNDSAKTVTFGVDSSVITLRSFGDAQYATVASLNTTNSNATALTGRVSTAEGNITALQSSKQANLAFTSPLSVASNTVSINTGLITALGTLTSLQVSGEAIAGKSLIVGNTIRGDTTSAKMYPPVMPMTSATMTVSQATGADYGYGLYTVNSSSTAGNFYNYYGFTTALTGAPWSSQNLYNVSTGSYTGSVSSSDTLGSTYLGEWLQIQFPIARLVSTFTIFPRVDNPLSAPTTFTLLASNDGTNWSAIFKQTSAITWVNNTSQTFTSNATQAFSFYRLVGQATGGGNNTGVSPYLQFSMYFTTVNTGLNLGSVSDSVGLPSVNALGCVSVGNTLTAATVAASGNLTVGGTIRNGNGQLNINDLSVSAPISLSKNNGAYSLGFNSDSTLVITSGSLGVNPNLSSLSNYVQVSSYNTDQTTLKSRVSTLESGFPILAGTGLTKTGNTLSVNSSQPQITSLGTLTSLTVSGDASVAGNITSSALTSTVLNPDLTVKQFPPAALPAPGTLGLVNTSVISGSQYGSGTYVTSQSSNNNNQANDIYSCFSGSGTFQSDQNYTNGDGSGPVRYTTMVGSTAYNGDWVQIQMPYPVTLKTWLVTPSGSAYAPAIFVILGSNDGNTWSMLYQQSTALAWTSNVAQTLSINSTTPYSYFRFVCQNIVGGAGPQWIMKGQVLSATREITALTASADSLSPSTGALTLAGGAGIAKSIFAGGNLSIAGSTSLTTLSAGNTSISGTLAVTGASTLGTLSASNTSIAGTLNVTGALTGTTAAFTSTSNVGDTLPSSIAGGAVCITGDVVTSRQIFPTNVSALGRPTFTTRSAGSRVVIWPQVSATAADYAMGMDSGALWTSIPLNASTNYFRWYGGTTQAAQLDGTGNMTLAGTQDSNSSSTGALQVTGGISAQGAIVSTAPHFFYVIQQTGSNQSLAANTNNIIVASTTSYYNKGKQSSWNSTTKTFTITARGFWRFTISIGLTGWTGKNYVTVGYIGGSAAQPGQVFNVWVDNSLGAPTTVSSQICTVQYAYCDLGAQLQFYANPTVACTTNSVAAASSTSTFITGELISAY